MTKIPISQKISNMYGSFSKQQKKVADYVINNIENIIYFPMSRFSDEIGVSNATLVRFAQQLGYDGFNDFREDLFTYYQNYLSPETRMRQSIEIMGDQPLSYESTAANEIKFMQASTTSVNEDSFKAAIDHICSARTLYVIGHGPNEHMAVYLNFRLRRLRIPCKLVNSGGRDVCDHFLTLSDKDAAIIYNFSRLSTDSMRVMNILKDHKATSILITDMRNPASTEGADYVLYAERGPEGTFPSPVVPMTITFALLLGVKDRLKKESINALKQLEDLRAKYFYKKPNSNTKK